MDDVDRRYTYIFFFMKFIGTWPYTLKYRGVRIVIINFFGLLYVIVQFAVLISDIELDTTLVLQQLAFSIVSFSSLLKSDFLWWHRSTVRYLIDGIKNTWNTANEEVREILEKHTKIGKRRTKVFLCMLVPGCAFTTLGRLQSYIAVVTAPPGTNFSDPFPIYYNYFVSDETVSKYFHLIVIHQLVAILIVGLIPMSTELIYLMWLEHGTTLFLISSHYLEKGFASTPPNASTKEIKKYRYDCFVSAIEFDDLGYQLVFAKSYYTRRKIFVTVIRDTFRLMYSVQFLLAVTTLAMNIFRMATALRVTHDMEELYLSTSLVGVHVFYMYYITTLMQSTGELAANLPTVAYNQPWYDRSVVDQKSILLIILLRANQAIVFDYYGFYKCTNESFTVMMKLSVSYLMMMLQFQEADELVNNE